MTSSRLTPRTRRTSTPDKHSCTPRMMSIGLSFSKITLTRNFPCSSFPLIAPLRRKTGSTLYQTKVNQRIYFRVRPSRIVGFSKGCWILLLRSGSRICKTTNPSNVNSSFTMTSNLSVLSSKVPFGPEYSVLAIDHSYSS